jgi:hypothetical protein
MLEAYDELGRATGCLGYPTTEESGGYYYQAYQNFQNGSIIFLPGNSPDGEDQYHVGTCGDDYLGIINSKHKICEKVPSPSFD